jgi:glycosyltransferase involved in cell wall biosynthesis
LASSRIGIVTFLPEPNHIEAQPNKLFEYMSAGIPVIASDFPLWREIVESNYCGLCVDPEDPKSIAVAIDWLLEHPLEAEQMGKNGQRAVLERYNWDNEARTLVARL